jgi:ABC-type antimicrobial peptide transport system permease subunit
LGAVDVAMNTGPRFVRDSLAGRLAARLPGSHVASVLALPGMVLTDSTDPDAIRQVNQVQVLGTDSNFWFLGGGAVSLGDEDVVLNRKLADRLGVDVGQTVGLRVARPALMTRDAPLASRKQDLSVRIQMRVSAIVADSALGRFSLTANQESPCNAFLRRDILQARLGLAERANLILVGGAAGGTLVEDVNRALVETWKIEDAGLSVTTLPFRLFQLESDRVFLDPAVAQAELSSPGNSDRPVGALTYLVNSIEKGEGADRKFSPYAFVVAVGASTNRVLSLVPPAMRDDQVLINRWLASHLGAKVGDALKVSYYEVLPSGEFKEAVRAFRVFDVVDVADLVTERDAMPEFPGLTDVDSCREWDIGMPMDPELLKDRKNEEYWRQFRATPKALFTLQAGQEMWGNRFGTLTGLRYPFSEEAGNQLADRLAQRLSPAKLGLVFLPVRAQALQAVDQAMDFGELFIGMSFFLIVAALMLTGLLFVFTVEQRQAELGTLMAMGFRVRHIRALVLGEGAVVALVGSGFGALLGVGYTRFLIWGLGHMWQGAVAGASIEYHAGAMSVLVGVLTTVLCSLAAMGVSAWRRTRQPVHVLLSGSLADDGQAGSGRPVGWRTWVTAGVFALAAVGTVGWVLVTPHANRTEGFFSAGAFLLISGLALGSGVLSVIGVRGSAKPTLSGLGLRNAARKRNRSLTVAGLLACGSFMVIAVSSMKEDLGREAGERWSGTGGFEWFGQSTLALTDAPESKRGAERWGLAGLAEMRGVDVVSMRVRNGDDASCLNLNRAQVPRLVGVDPARFSDLRAFLPRKGKEDVWALLGRRLPDGAVPGLAGDLNTAMWGLQMKTGLKDGDTLTYTDERGNPFKVRLVGSVPNRLTVFQGSVLISMDAFGESFPSEEGFRMFLVDAPVDRAGAVRQVLTRRLEKVGLELVSGRDRLEEFSAVESTYLAMFLVLGGLGLVLGSIGLGVVVLRSALERRRELALMRSVGFARGNLIGMMLVEHGYLLAMGLAMGLVASVIAVWPSLQTAGMGVPVGVIGLVLAGMVAVGLFWALLAALWATRGSLLDSLRSE